MSLEIETFVPDINDAIIPRWLQRMNGFDMRCEIHPAFSFNDHSGFLPFRVAFERSAYALLLGVDYLTGFEFYIGDFNLAKELEVLTPAPTIFAKLAHRVKLPAYYATSEIDQKLASCKKVLRFIWGSADTLELRMATLSSAVLAEITSGICHYSADQIWYSNEGIVENTLRDVETYEASLRPDQWRLHKFEKWL